MRLFVVIYTDDDGPYAVIFTAFDQADQFARIFDGVIIDAVVNSHLDCCV